MSSHLSPQQLNAWRSFLRAHARVVARLEEELDQEHHLQITWYEVLLLLREAPEGRLRMHELAESRLLSRSAATRLIDRMEDAGLVERAISSDDRRGTFVALTPDGLAALRRTAPAHLRGIEEHFARQLSDEETEVVAETMTRIADLLAKRPRRL
jgi:DNA-binding MarR family transcriptional regulator